MKIKNKEATVSRGSDGRISASYKSRIIHIGEPTAAASTKKGIKGWLWDASLVLLGVILNEVARFIVGRIS